MSHSSRSNSQASIVSTNSEGFYSVDLVSSSSDGYQEDLVNALMPAAGSELKESIDQGSMNKRVSQSEKPEEEVWFDDTFSQYCHSFRTKKLKLQHKQKFFENIKDVIKHDFFSFLKKNPNNQKKIKDQLIEKLTNLQDFLSSPFFISLFGSEYQKAPKAFAVFCSIFIDFYPNLKHIMLSDNLAQGYDEETEYCQQVIRSLQAKFQGDYFLKSRDPQLRDQLVQQTREQLRGLILHMQLFSDSIKKTKEKETELVDDVKQLNKAIDEKDARLSDADRANKRDDLREMLKEKGLNSGEVVKLFPQKNK